MARNKKSFLYEPAGTEKPHKLNSARKNGGARELGIVDPEDADFAARCKILGENIRHERKSRGFSIENLAEYLELSTSYVGLLERGARCPSMKNFFNMCDLFSSTPNNLILPKKMEGSKVAVSEQKHSAARNSYDAIISLLKNFDENELSFVADTLKNLKKLQKSN